MNSVHILSISTLKGKNIHRKMDMEGKLVIFPYFREDETKSISIPGVSSQALDNACNNALA
jgi:hypothetical protein